MNLYSFPYFVFFPKLILSDSVTLFCFVADRNRVMSKHERWLEGITDITSFNEQDGRIKVPISRGRFSACVKSPN